jgi:hypothetical protein
MARRSRSPRTRTKSAGSPSVPELFRSVARSIVIACLAGGADALEAGAGDAESGSAPVDCTPERRREALRALQSAVTSIAPREVDSLDEATQPGGPLAGWRLSHGLVVMDGAEAVAVDNLAAKDPMPPLLLYAPSRKSSPADWSDFDDPDGP